MNTQLTGEAVLKLALEDWGERSLYSVDGEQYAALVQSGATKLIVDQDNKDGTFYNEVAFEGRKFGITTATKLNG